MEDRGDRVGDPQRNPSPSSAELHAVEQAAVEHAQARLARVEQSTRFAGRARRVGGGLRRTHADDEAQAPGIVKQKYAAQIDAFYPNKETR